VKEYLTGLLTCKK